MQLGLTNEEATVLITLLSEVSGSPAGTVRTHINTMFLKLKKHGYTNISPAKLFVVEQGNILCNDGGKNVLESHTHQKFGYFPVDN